MELFEAIRTRRSVRSSTTQPLTETEIETLLHAAMQASNSGNQQAWRFVVVDDPHLVTQIGELDVDRGPYHVSQQLFVVCADIASMEWKMHWLADCAAAIQNMLLAAHAMDLGGVWQELFPYHRRVSAVRDLLGIPKTAYPMAVVAIGHPATRPDPSDRFDPAKAFRNQWGEELARERTDSP